MDLKDLLPVAILLGVTVIGIVLMAQINQKLYDTHTADTSLNGSAQNISGEGLNSMQELGQI